MTKGVPKFLTPLDQTCSDSHPMRRKAPRHDLNAPHGSIQGAPPPATILGKSPIKLSETPPNPTSVLREIFGGGEPIPLMDPTSHVANMLQDPLIESTDPTSHVAKHVAESTDPLI